MATNVDALFVLDAQRKLTGEMYRFCSPLCRSAFTQEWSPIYRADGLTLHAGPGITVTRPTFCDFCGVCLTD